MGVTFVPLVGPKKAGEKEKEVERSNEHAWKLHELSKPVNDGSALRRKVIMGDIKLRLYQL
jgi:hypothetical protein